eukprot:TRINITY_DN81724_c0_g1_i1.p1 TRINITY_DN81724_c0_g1~~TRINITY_DN81724_c0_g1_i1.p1  ORF type:complete len:447 (-),score=79.42 TRINITY_DN81724_c0_g1_i1:336-1676(-)
MDFPPALLGAGAVAPMYMMYRHFFSAGRESHRPGMRKPSPQTKWTACKDMADLLPEQAPRTGKNYLVIGTGSVGVAIMDALLERGEQNVRGFDLVTPRQVVPSINRRMATDAVASEKRRDDILSRVITGDVTDYEAVKKVCEGVDVVYATFALIRYYERLDWQYSASHAVNVTGTHNVIRACIECGVQILVQTSSSSVAGVPGQTTLDMDETAPYCTQKNSPSHYVWSKVQAELAVLEANGSALPSGRRLATGAVRPCSGIFGPADNLIVQKALESGELNVLVEDAKSDYVFVENVAWGHLLLEQKLLTDEGRKKAGGQAFCISNNEPIVAGDFFDAIGYFNEQATGQAMPKRVLPRGLMTVIAWCVESYQRVRGKRMAGDLALLTPPVLTISGMNYAFKSKKAHDVLGYSPLFTVDQALQKTVDVWNVEKQRANNNDTHAASSWF